MKKTEKYRFITVMVLLAAMTSAFSQTPKGPYLLIRDGNLGGVTVAWTSSVSSPFTLEYGLTESLGSSMASVATSINGSAEYRHECNFTGLDDGTKYFYEVTVEGTLFEGSFRTPPASTAQSVKFFVYSDPQDIEPNSPRNGHNSAAAYMNEVYDEDPEYQTFLLSAGDNANSPEEYYGTFFNGAEYLVPNNPVRIMLRNLFFATAKGNHDKWDQQGNDYSAYFASLFPYASGREYFSYDYGPVHVTVLDIYDDLSAGSPQALWLEQDLAATEKPWKIIAVHEPGWSAEVGPNYPNNPYVQSVVQPLCKKYNVAFVFSGHLHLYTRAMLQATDGPKVRHIETSTIGPSVRTPLASGPNVVFMQGNLRNLIKINIIDDHTLEYTPVISYGSSYGTEFDNFTISRPYNIQVASNTGASATITWMSDIAGGDTVLYGTSINNVYSAPVYASGPGGSTSHSVNLTGLVPNTTYYYRVKTNGECSDYKSFTAVSVPPAAEPTVQASDVLIDNISSTGMTINWTSGNGSNRLVLMRAGSAVTGTPADQTRYNASTVFGSGSTISSGNYVVYNGTGSSVTITGLPSSTTCHVAVFEFNGSDYSENYLTVNPARGNGTTLIGVPVASAATDRLLTSFTANWGSVTGAAGYRLDVSTSSSFAGFLPSFENLDVGNVTSYPVSGLTAGITHYYRVRAYSGSTSDNSNTISVIPLASEPVTQASGITFSAVTAGDFTISWTRGSGDYCIVLMKAGSAVSADPADGSTYTASETFGSGSNIGYNNYVVYAGSGNSVDVTGLSSATTYHVAVYEFNGSGSSENYLQVPERNSQATLTLPGTYKSNASGLWSAGSTWLFAQTDAGPWSVPSAGPTASSAGIVDITWPNEITVASDVTVDEVYISTGAQLTVNSGYTLTVASIPYTMGLYIEGTLKNSGTIAGSGPIVFINSGSSRYIHSSTSTTLPVSNWHSSTIIEFAYPSDIVPAGTYPNLTLTGSEKSLLAGEGVTVSGNMVTNNLLTIASSGLSSSGSLIVNGTSTGNIVFNRTMNPAGFHYFSSPVIAGTFPTAGTVYKYNELTDQWETTTSNSPGIGYAHQTGVTSLSFGGGVRTADLSIYATSPYSEPFDGSTYTGREKVTGRDFGGGGFNLLGNPFTSFLTITDEDADLTNDFLSVNSASFDPNYKAVYLWNGNAYNYIGGSTGWDEGNPTLLSQELIQPGQGFFVLAMNNLAQFRFTGEMQAHGTGVQLLKSSGPGERWPGLQIKAESGKAAGRTMIIFNDGMSTGLDPGFDVGLISSGGEIDIYSTLVSDNGVNFARQALPESGSLNNIVPVGIDFTSGGDVTFSAVTEPLRNYKFWLEDRTTGIFTDLSADTYTVILPARTYGTGRFFIHVTFSRPTRNNAGIDNLHNLRIWASQERQVIVQGALGGPAKCEIYDMKGQKVLEKALSDERMNTIAVPKDLSGVFFVRVTDGEAVTTRKVIIL